MTAVCFSTQMQHLFADTALFGIDISPNLKNASEENLIKLYEPKLPLPNVYFMSSKPTHQRIMKLYKNYMFQVS